MKYFVAALQQEEENPLACLIRYGLPQKQAQFFDATAAELKSGDYLVIPFETEGKEEGLALIILKGEKGVWESWHGLIDEPHLCDTVEQATGLAKEIHEEQRADVAVMKLKN
jgi:hypothetical protein